MKRGDSKHAACDNCRRQDDRRHFPGNRVEKAASNRLCRQHHRFALENGCLGKNSFHRSLLRKPIRILIAQKEEQKCHRRKPIELDALLLQLPHLGLYALAPIGKLRGDCTLRNVERFRDFLHRKLFIVIHTDDQLLFFRKLFQNLPHQSGVFLLIHLPLRLIGCPHFRKIELHVVLTGQVGKGERRFPRQLGHCLIDRNPAQPRQNRRRILQFLDTPIGTQIGVLLDVLRKGFVAHHRANRAEHGRTGQVIKRRKRIVVPRLHLPNQFRRQAV